MGEAKAKLEAVKSAEEFAEKLPDKVPMRLSPTELAIMLIIEAQAQQLQNAANQLGGFLGLTEAADVLLSAQKHLNDWKMRFMHKLQSQVVLAGPNDIPMIRKDH